MTNEKYPNYIFTFILGSLLLIAANSFKSQVHFPKITIDKQTASRNLDYKVIRIFAIGQNRFLSSLFWIITLLEADTSHYQKSDLNSWLYRRFKSIVELDPYFYEAYLYGGKYLSIIKNDLLGAKDLYTQGLKFYPGDVKLNLSSAFHYYFELGDVHSALQHYKNILHSSDALKRVPFLASLVAKLEREKSPNLQSSFDIVFNAYRDPRNKDYINIRLEQSLYSLRAEIDLECLNNFKKNCRTRDFRGELYIKKGQKYHAKSQWSPFSIKKRGPQKAPSNF